MQIKTKDDAMILTFTMTSLLKNFYMLFLFLILIKRNGLVKCNLKTVLFQNRFYINDKFQDYIASNLREVAIRTK